MTDNHHAHVVKRIREEVANSRETSRRDVLVARALKEIGVALARADKLDSPPDSAAGAIATFNDAMARAAANVAVALGVDESDEYWDELDDVAARDPDYALDPNRFLRAAVATGSRAVRKLAEFIENRDDANLQVALGECIGGLVIGSYASASAPDPDSA